MRWWRNEAGTAPSYTLYFVIIFGLVVLTAGYAVAKTDPLMRLSAAGAEETADHFLRAVSAGDISETKALSAGRVAFNVARAGETGLPKAEVVAIDTETVAVSDKWARVRATVELTLADGSPDIGWYELELVNGDGWKVVNVRETAPVVTGRGRRVSDEDLAEMRTVFERYLQLVAAGKYDQAAKECLAGPARRGQEAATTVFGHAAGIRDVRDLRVTPLYGRDTLAIADFRYRVDNRATQVVATFYQTQQGWRGVDIRESN